MAGIVVRVIFFSLLGPIALSLSGPIYFAYTHAQYSTAVVWALACALWWAQPSFEAALTDTNWLRPVWYKSTLIVAVVAILAFAFVSGDSLAYFLARSLSN
jgi:hypothetical protein